MADVSKLSSEEQSIIEAFHKLYYPFFAETRWMGVPALKCPFDLFVYQEMIYELRPDLIIECGTAQGGSAVFLASICNLIGHGEVVTIDIDHAVFPANRTYPRLTFLTGHTLSSEILRQLEAICLTRERVLVILDDDHSCNHVLDELRVYSRFVTVGSYLVLEDTNINGHPVLPEFGPGPMEALELFLKENSEFEVDRSREKFLVSFNPKGFLKKIRDRGRETANEPDQKIHAVEIKYRALQIDSCGRRNLQKFQVFLNQGGKYSEENSISTDLTLGEWHDLRLEMPCGMENGPLRIDPVDCCAVVDIKELTLRECSDDTLIVRLANNEIAKVAVGGTSIRLPDEGLLRLFSYGNDPQILVSFDSFAVPKEPLALHVRMRVQPDLSGIASLITECWTTETNLRGDLLAAQSEIQGLMRKLADAESKYASETDRNRALLESRSWRLTAPLRQAAALFRRDVK